MAPDLIWLLVAYRNLGQVDDFVDQLRALPGSERFGYAICDNSPETGVSRHANCPDTVFVARPDNPGYLEGGLAGLDAHVTAAGGAVPEWVALSNTDLSFRSGNPLTALALHDAHKPCVIAPRITEGESCVEKNPHVVARRSLRRLRANATFAIHPITTMAYQLMAIVRSDVLKRREAGRHHSRAWRETYAEGTVFYSPYGALMFFSRRFIEARPLPRRVPLLAEEYFIAEAAADHGAPVLFEPRIHAHHDAHVTTGSKVSLTRARGTSRAFKEIYLDARRRRGAGGA